MIALLYFVLAILTAPFKSKSRLEAENAALRHQLIVLRRRVHGRVRFTSRHMTTPAKIYTAKLQPNDDHQIIAGRLTRQLRDALRGKKDLPPAGFGAPLNYPKSSIY